MNVKILSEAYSRFVSNCVPDEFIRTDTGVNNRVYYVKCNHETKSVLRIYNNGNDTRKIQTEHRILNYLSGMYLPYAIPNANLDLIENKPYVVLSNNSVASLFTLIEGQNPKLYNVLEVGIACGLLNSAMSKIQLDPSISIRLPYCMIYSVHPCMTRDLFFAQLKRSDVQVLGECVAELEGWMHHMEEKIPELLSNDLPRQWIHGDLNYDNVLCDDCVVTGIVDFEFSSYDWRAMELATALSKYAAESDPLSYFIPFVQGYSATAVPLTAAEISVLPDLIMLRVLSMSVYFIGRALTGEDSWASFLNRLHNYCHRLQWTHSHRDDIVSLFCI